MEKKKAQCFKLNKLLSKKGEHCALKLKTNGILKQAVFCQE